MSDVPVDAGRRRLLTATTAVVGGVGAVFTAVPFIASWNPSEKAKAAGAPVEVDISKLEPGQLIRVEWRGKPVWIVKRTGQTLQALANHEDKLLDPESAEPQQPDYAKNRHRSLKPEILVAVGICTHLGCSPLHMPDGFSAHAEGIDAGFFCPCHGSIFDMAGRVFKGVPANLNLVIPPYSFIDETTLIVGLEGESA